MNICYTGPCFDYSGYGEANRHFINALHLAGVNVKVQSVSYVLDLADFGEIGRVCKQLTKNDIDYPVKILHITPDQYPKFVEPGKYHIGHLFWETDRLPRDFALPCDLLDEIWTGSETTAQAIRNAGVKKPIFVFPQPIEVKREKVSAYKVNNHAGFLFYSIFEWSERKNPHALMRAFYEEFSADEKVALLIKTYFDSFTYERNEYVMGEMKRLKREYGAGSAPIYLYRYLMDRHQVNRLHTTGDCFISCHRGEGWGIPIVEAMVHGKPVIATGYNGVADYLSDKEAYLLPYKLIQVNNMQRNSQWYTNEQNWADVDIADIRKTMRYIFEHQKEAKAKGKVGQKFVEKNFNFQTVGEQMAIRLKQITKEL